MAFATANVQTTTIGNLRATYGDWSGAAGDTAGTIGVEGGRVYLCNFSSQDSSGPSQGFYPFSPSTSGTVTTVSVYYHDTVTTGRFLIIHA